MKVVILAGGFGSRISEYTKTIPKPMIKVGGKPILYHIMKLCDLIIEGKEKMKLRKILYLIAKQK